MQYGRRDVTIPTCTATGFSNQTLVRLILYNILHLPKLNLNVFSLGLAKTSFKAEFNKIIFTSIVYSLGS